MCGAKSMIFHEIVQVKTAQISLFKSENEKAWMVMPIFQFSSAQSTNIRSCATDYYNIMWIML